MFTPVLIVSVIILFYFPRYKLRCIEHEIHNILSNDKDDNDINEAVIKRYIAVVEFLKIKYFPFFYLIKNKPMSIVECIDAIGIDDVNG